MREDPNSVNGGMEYVGNWWLERMYVDDGELPDVICTSMEESADPLMAGFPSIGDFIIDDYTVRDGRVWLHYVQANNGDSLFSMVYGEYDGVWEKVTEAYYPDGEGPLPDWLEGLM